jgi:hypothetical protein
MSPPDAVLRIVPCPDCDGPLSEPISGDVHCYLQCLQCGHRFDLKDPRIDLG